MDIPTRDLPDRRFSDISNGLIRYHLEAAITMWAQDVSIRDRPSATYYAGLSMNDAEWAAHLLSQYLGDVMRRLAGIGYPPAAPHLVPYDAYPHSRFFRKGGKFSRIQATETLATPPVQSGPSPPPALFPTPAALLPPAPSGTPPAASVAGQADGHPCFWHICHLAGLTKIRNGETMICQIPSCPDPHPATMPVLT